MPTNRQYASNAERQAAYRARHADRKLATEAELAILARSLHMVLEQALKQGAIVVPSELLGTHAGETLRNLIRHLETDPIRRL